MVNRETRRKQDKGKEARKMMKNEFENLIHGSLTDEEIRSLNRAKDSLVAERERLKKGA